MEKEIIYMLGIVAVGFAVNYTLRALPFIIFAGADRTIPNWVAKLGDVISPVIIGALIIYSYSGLEWRTAYPYIAGAVTVFLQLWRRNPLISIVTATVLYMVLLTCGCASERIVDLNAKNTEIRITNDGAYIGEEWTNFADVIEFLQDNDIPKDRVIHIRLDPEVKDLRPARLLMGAIAKAGWTRPVLVTERHSLVEKSEAKRRPSSKSATTAAPKKIRYKKGSE